MNSVSGTVWASDDFIASCRCGFDYSVSGALLVEALRNRPETGRQSGKVPSMDIARVSVPEASAKG
ncbi:hypothetical protein FB554_1350 [Barrientosiimonas humi]|uniref:Uncharacterized protein n=1 Tax=Barrientosiimonas humi TaxID=999931 RepID=A0A542XBJ9_9MICO|nr:hypothetical protein FB554_1350 [Barrientosiimonas humi]CAG7573202.1 hypothetical protein BH39T_PBIAJDOK_01829 [Barrientosiimonas humi]